MKAIIVRSFCLLAVCLLQAEKVSSEELAVTWNIGTERPYLYSAPCNCVNSELALPAPLMVPSSIATGPCYSAYLENPSVNMFAPTAGQTAIFIVQSMQNITIQYVGFSPSYGAHWNIELDNWWNTAGGTCYVRVKFYGYVTDITSISVDFEVRCVESGSKQVIYGTVVAYPD